MGVACLKKLCHLLDSVSVHPVYRLTSSPPPQWVHHPSSSRFSSWLIRKSFVIRIRIVLTPTCLLSWQEKFAKLKSFSCISLRNCKLYLLICPGVSYARSASAAAVPCPSAIPTRKTRSFRQLNNPYLYLMDLPPVPPFHLHHVQLVQHSSTSFTPNYRQLARQQGPVAQCDKSGLSCTQN